MEVVIVGRTRMGQGRVCIGALSIGEWASLRLLPFDNLHSWPENQPFQVGDVWDVSGEKMQGCRPPHLEDFQIWQSRYLRPYGAKLRTDIEQNTGAVNGSLKDLFQNKLRAIRSGSICIRSDSVPTLSTQFWLPPYDLNYDHPYYRRKRYRIKYVGCAPPIDVIPAGSLVRVSLARWFRPDGHDQEACYLQVSGWWI